MVGPNCELPSSVTRLCDKYSSHELRPCPETLTPWPWSSRKGEGQDHRVGNVLCDMYLPDGDPDLICPRQQLKKQVAELQKRHGLIIKSAFEYEFFAFKENTRQPLGSDRLMFANLRVWGENRGVMAELRKALEEMGVQVRTMQAEFPPGQWELTTPPYEGVHGADVAFYVKNAVKGVLKAHGYDATFMTRPSLSSIGSGLHLNHSLWTQDGARNVFADGESGGLSATVKHWMGGVLTHGPALTALSSPTLSCYRRVHNVCAPTVCTWGEEDRGAILRARQQGGSNVFLENRLVSAAASPYLALAGTIAAGLDGLDRRLDCPAPQDSSRTGEVPHSLAEALTALEQDERLTDLLGQDFVSCYVQSKRQLEVEPFDKADLKTEDEQVEFERDMYYTTY